MDEQPTDLSQSDPDEFSAAELEPNELEADELDDTEPDDDDSEAGSSVPGVQIEELVRYVATRLVQSPDEIMVESEFRGGTVYVSLRVPEQEMGRVIGREGRTAKAIRTLVSIAGSRQNVHARLDIDG